MTSGRNNPRQKWKMILDREGEMPTYHTDTERKPELLMNGTTLVKIIERNRKPTIEVDSRLVEILEGEKMRKIRAISEERTMAVVIDYATTGYEVDLCNLGGGAKDSWLRILQLPYTDRLEGKMWGTSIQTDFHLKERVHRLLVDELIAKRRAKITTWSVGKKSVFSYESKVPAGGGGRIPLPHIAIEKKGRTIESSYDSRHKESFPTSWTGLEFDLNVFKLYVPRLAIMIEDEDVLNQTSFRYGLKQIYLSVGENKSGFMVQSKYSDGTKVEIIQAWHSGVRCWHNHISGPTKILERLREYGVTFR